MFYPTRVAAPDPLAVAVNHLSRHVRVLTGWIASKTTQRMRTIVNITYIRNHCLREGLLSAGACYKTKDVPFLARDSMLSALYAIARPSVCLSVCPSVCLSVRPSVCHTGGSVKNG